VLASQIAMAFDHAAGSRTPFQQLPILSEKALRIAMQCVQLSGFERFALEALAFGQVADDGLGYRGGGTVPQRRNRLGGAMKLD
jgi:hypothetical protein